MRLEHTRVEMSVASIWPAKVTRGGIWQQSAKDPTEAAGNGP